MVGTTISSIRANATREMRGVEKHVKNLSQEMSSGKRNVTSMSSLDLIQRNLLRTQGNVLEGAVAGSVTARTNVTLAINALNAVGEIFQDALAIANTVALDPTADIAQLSAEYLLMVAGADANAFSRKTLSSTKDINGTAIFATAVSPVAGDTITMTPTFDATTNANFGGAAAPVAMASAANGAVEVAKMKLGAKAVAAEIARLNDFLTMLDSKVGQMGEQSDSALDALAPIVDTDLPAASSQLNADITKASMIGAVLNADASLTSAVNDAAMRILNRG